MKSGSSPLKTYFSMHSYAATRIQTQRHNSTDQSIEIRTHFRLGFARYNRCILVIIINRKRGGQNRGGCRFTPAMQVYRHSHHSSGKRRRRGKTPSTSGERAKKFLPSDSLKRPLELSSASPRGVDSRVISVGRLVNGCVGPIIRRVPAKRPGENLHRQVLLAPSGYKTQRGKGKVARYICGRQFESDISYYINSRQIPIKSKESGNVP